MLLKSLTVETENNINYYTIICLIWEEYHLPAGGTCIKNNIRNVYEINNLKPTVFEKVTIANNFCLFIYLFKHL